MSGTINTFTEESMRRIAREIFREERETVRKGPRNQTIAGFTGDAVPSRGVMFVNQSGEEAPPYACMEITGLTDRGGVPCYSITKPTTIHGSQLWLVNGPRAAAYNGYGFGTWASEPSPVMMWPGPFYGGTKQNWAPAFNNWFLIPTRIDDTDGLTSAYGFRREILGAATSHPYVFDYPSPVTSIYDGHLWYGIFQQMPEPAEISRTWIVDGLNSSGWTNSTDETLTAASPIGWLSATTADPATFGYRLGWRADGGNDPENDGLIQRMRTEASYYRFILTLNFEYDLTGTYSGTATSGSGGAAHTHTLSAHTHSGGAAPSPDVTGSASATAHTHTVPDPQDWYNTGGPILEVYDANEGSPFQVRFYEQFSSFSVNKQQFQRTIVWEAKISGYASYGVRLQHLNASKHSFNLLDPATYPPSTFTAIRLRDAERIE